MAVLVADVGSAQMRRRAEDSQTHRRDVIRTLFAAVEGLVWTYREHVVEIASTSDQLTATEEQALSETAYQVTSQGKVVEQTRFIPMLGMIRLVTRIAQRMSPDLAIEFDDIGWNSVRAAVEIRNRITHPKSKKDLMISPKDLATCEAAFFWLFEKCIQAMDASTNAFRNHVSMFRQVVAALEAGDPDAWKEYRDAGRSIGS